MSAARATTGPGRSSKTFSTLLIATLALLTTSVVARQAHADTGTVMPARRVVEVLVAGDTADGVGLDATVRELLDRLALVTETQAVGHVDADDASFRSTARPSLLARVGVDLRDKDVVIILVVDGRTGDLVDRRVVRRDATPAVVREEVAHVVQSAVDPLLLAERDRASTPPPPPPPAPIATTEPPAPPARGAPPRRTRAPSPLSLDVQTAAGGGSYASGAGVVARAGGGAVLVWRRGLRPGIGVYAHYVFPFEIGDTTVSAHVNVMSFRALPSIELTSNGAVALDLDVGGGLDVLHVSPRTSELPSDLLGVDATRVDPVLTGGVTGHVAISGGTSVSLMLGADVDVTSREWVVAAADGGLSPTFVPSRVRAIAMLGFTFTAFGVSRFAASPGASK